MKRAVTYARTSYDDSGSDQRNINGQILDCRQFAERSGWEVVGEFSDEKVSGANWDAPGLNAALDLAKAGGFDILVVRELDRLSRDPGKLYYFKQEFENCKVQIEFTLGNYPKTPEGQFTMGVMASLAELEKELLKRRMWRGRINKIKAGSVMTNQKPPRGYRQAEHDGLWTLEINENEALRVRSAFEWYAAGESAWEVGQRLGMAVPSVLYMLANRVYLGEWVFHAGKPDAIPVAVPAIVTPEVWQQAQERRKQNRRDARRNLRYTYLMRGRLRCECGAACTALTHIRETKVYQYYRCSTLCHHKSCGLPHFPADKVDALAWSWLKEITKDPAKLTEKFAEYQRWRAERNKPIAEKIKALVALIHKHEAELTKLLDLYLTSDFPKDLLDRRQAEIRKVLDGLKAEKAATIAKLSPMGRGLADPVELCEKLQILMQTDDFDKRLGVVVMLNCTAVLKVIDGERWVELSAALPMARELLPLEDKRPAAVVDNSQQFWYLVELLPLVEAGARR